MANDSKISEVNAPRAPDPPYYCVVFSSWRSDLDESGYRIASERMVELARQQPGFIGVESTRDADGFGITVSYWESEQAISNWRQNAEHLEAQRAGQSKWYRRFSIRVCQVLRQQITDGSTDSHGLTNKTV